MDDLDRQLISLLVRGMPLVKRPYRVLASQLGIDEADLFMRLSNLKRAGIIAGVRAKFNGKLLGYRSALFAMRFRAGCIEKAAERLKEHPGVNYLARREHAFSLWGTVSLGYDDTFVEHEELLRERLEGVEQILLMPSLKMFKIAGSSGSPHQHAVRIEPNPSEQALIRELQKDFPVADRPYASVAKRCDLSEEEVISKMQAWVRNGISNPVSALFPEKIRDEFSEMWVAWRIPEEKIEKIGRYLARYRVVTQCVSRPAQKDWLYTLYTKIKVSSLVGCHEVTRHMEGRIGQWPWVSLVTLKEFKKSTLVYFDNKWEDWRNDSVFSQKLSLMDEGV